MQSHRASTASCFRAIIATIIVIMLTGCGMAAPQRQISFHPLESVFKKVRDVTLRGVDPQSELSLAMDPHGNIYVVDLAHTNIREFDSNGRLIKSLGGYGWGPGEFMVPWSVACDDRSNVYGLDIKTGRINVFGADGRLQRSVLTGVLGFRATVFAVDRSGDIYLVGRKVSDQNGTLIYKLNSDGRLLVSFYEEEPSVKKLNLSVVGDARLDVDASTSDVYAIQPVSPKVSVFSPTGQLVRIFGESPDFYSPPIKFPDPLPQDHKAVQDLLDKWTELVDLRLIPEQHLVLLTFNVHSPVGHGIEIYTEDGGFVAGPIGTTLYPAFTTAGGRVDFYSRAGSDLELSEFLVNLPKEGT